MPLKKLVINRIMKFVEKKKSLELCTEAGWIAYDVFVDKPIDEDFIEKFRCLGNFVYLDFLKEPFYKIESNYFLIKGIKNRKYFRLAVHSDYEMQVEKEVYKA